MMPRKTPATEEWDSRRERTDGLGAGEEGSCYGTVGAGADLGLEGGGTWCKILLINYS